jgi:Ca2+-binding RTX toxin-like protein
MSDPIFSFTSTNPYGMSDVGTNASPTFVDIDGDGDLDAFVGNYDGNTLFFRNIGTIHNPSFVAPSTNPFGLSDVGLLAHSNFVDIDDDGDLDAFVGNDSGNTLFFRNTGTVSNPVFAIPSTNPFGLSTVGFNANPSFVDVDGDGDQDAFVGNDEGNSLFYRNTGAASNPVFAAASANPFGLSDVGISASPTLVDIDGDHDLDAFLGNSDGDTLFYRNTGTASNPLFFFSGPNVFGLSNVGYSASPTFVDIDGDGDLDAFVGNAYGNTLFYLNAATSLQFSTAGNDTLTGTSSFNDTVSYASATGAVAVSLDIIGQQNTIGAGLDTLTDIENLIGSDFNDKLIGNTKNNFLNGGTGNDTLVGGLGDDTYVVDSASDVITENLSEGTDQVSSSVTYTLPVNVENLTLTGSLAINVTGNSLANSITGNTAGNVLNGGAGADSLIGGLGNDTYTVDNAGDFVMENLNEGTDKVNSSVAYTLSINVENLTLTGASAINGTGNDLANSLTGNAAINVLSGGAGNDTLNGGAGADSLTGGLGNDTYTVDNAGDAVTENLGEGTDKINSSVTYTLSANVENLTLTGALAVNGTGNDLANSITGNAAINVLIGGTGNDTLNGGAGADSLIGGLGNDTYTVDNAGDVVTENLGEGTDKVNSSVTYTLSANVENLTLTGSSAINGTGNDLVNNVTGNTADNLLNGGAGNDTLNGGAGNDMLSGGTGKDTMTGGTGSDTFRFIAKDSIDKIIDYNVADDTIQLEDSIFTALTTIGTLAANNFIIGTSAADSNDFIVYNTATGALLYDADGNGAVAAVQIATLTGGLALTNADIVVI